MSLYRFKCPSCGTVKDLPLNSSCPNCNQPFILNNAGYVQIYRMGSPIGVAVGYGIYINELPFGHIGNTESVRIPLPYGTYKFHFTCGMTRKCNDITVKLTPDEPTAYIKAHIKMGFWANEIIAERSTLEQMPPMD